MGILASILIALGFVALIAGGFFLYRGGRISKATLLKTGEAASGKAVAKASVQGRLICDTPLLSPVTKTPCLYYQVKVIGSWKSGDTKQSKDYIKESEGAQVSIDDGSGPVSIHLGDGGDLPLKETFQETKKEGVFGGLKNALGKSETMMFGEYAFDNPPMSKATSFKCIEKVVPVMDKGFALGKLNDGVLRGSGMFGLLLSPKTRDELLGSSRTLSRICLFGGGGAVGLGAALGSLSLCLGF